MNQALMIVIAAGVVLGGVDRVCGNRLGLGQQFEKGFQLLGPMALSMAGMICLAPVLAGGLGRIVAPFCRLTGVDPAMFGSLLAIDMGGYQLAKELFTKPIDYSAIFASTDSNALGLLKAADDAHIDIPGQLSLIGFDNISSTALPRIELTTVEQPKRDMAVQAVDMLRDKIENGTQGYVHQILMPTLIKRSTCRDLREA